MTLIATISKSSWMTRDNNSLQIHYFYRLFKEIDSSYWYGLSNERRKFFYDKFVTKELIKPLNNISSSNSSSSSSSSSQVLSQEDQIKALFA